MIIYFLAGSIVGCCFGFALFQTYVNVKAKRQRKVIRRAEYLIAPWQDGGRGIGAEEQMAKMIKELIKELES